MILLEEPKHLAEIDMVDTMYPTKMVCIEKDHKFESDSITIYGFLTEGAFMAEGVFAARHFAWYMALPVKLLKAYKAAQVLLLKLRALLLGHGLLPRAELLCSVVRRQKEVLQVVTECRCQVDVFRFQTIVHIVN